MNEKTTNLAKTRPPCYTKQITAIDLLEYTLLVYTLMSIDKQKNAFNLELWCYQTWTFELSQQWFPTTVKIQMYKKSLRHAHM